MRTISTIIAFFVVAWITQFNQPDVAAQPRGDATRYSGALAQPAIVAEEIPSGGQAASAPAPLNLGDGNAGQSWDRDATRVSKPAAADAAQQNAVPADSLPANARRNQFLPQALSDPSSTATPPRSLSSQPSDNNAKDWLAQLLALPPGAELSGQPISLAAAVEGSVGRERQTEVVAAYWQLAIAVAKYHVAYRSRQTIGVENAPRAATVFEADLQQAKLDAIRTQHRLAEVLQWEPGRMPLPNSQPHAGSYKTRYDEIFIGRNSRRAWELHETLPLLYDLLKTRADAVAGAQADAAAFRRQADAFLDVVGEYNLAIAEYAVLATGDTLSGHELVPLLIRTGRDEDHVAGSRNGDGKTSSRDNSATSPRRAIVDPRVRRTAGERPVARSSERSVLTQPGGTARTPRLAQTPRGQSTTSSGSSPSDQWRQRDPSSSVGADR